VVGRDAVHVFRLMRDTAEKISSAHDDGDLHAQLVHLADLAGHFVDVRQFDVASVE
jgi:hypothetical protein